MSVMKLGGLICLLLVAYFLSRAYRNFREERLCELEAFSRALGVVRENVQVYHTFRPLPCTEEIAPLVRLGFRGEEDVISDLLAVVPKMNLLPEEKKKFSQMLHTLGDGNLESEKEKVENIIKNVKSVLQKEEKEGKTSVDTVRIVLFTIALALVILLL